MSKPPGSLSAKTASPPRICTPGKLQGNRTSPTVATLTWSEPYATCDLCPDAVGYEVSGSTFQTMHVTRPPCEIQLGNTYGTLRVHVRAKAANGILSDPGVFVFLSSPGSPLDLRAGDFTESGFTLNWKAPIGGVPAFDYVIFRNGNVVATVRGLTYEMKHAAQPVDRYEVRARSNASNLSDPAVLDITPPKSPTGLIALNLSSRAAVLVWTATTDNIGVVKYEVLKDDVLIDTTTNATPAYAATGLIPDTEYLFAVRALDAAGNRSAPSSPITVKTAVLDPPQNVRVVTRTRSSIAIAWERPAGAIGWINYRSEADNHRGSSRVTESLLLGTTFTGLTRLSTYTVKISAYDASQRHSDSVTLEVKTL